MEQKPIEELLREYVKDFAKKAGLEESDVDWWVSWCREMDLDRAFAHYVLPEFDEQRQAELTDLYEEHFGRAVPLTPAPPKVEVYRPCCDRWVPGRRPDDEAEKLRKNFAFLKSEFSVTDEQWDAWMDEVEHTDVWTAFERAVLPLVPAEEKSRLRQKLRNRRGF